MRDYKCKYSCVYRQGGGYVAETYSTVVALAGKWVYQVLPSSSPDPDPPCVRTDTENIDGWTKNEIKDTLRSRGISVTGKNRKAELLKLLQDTIAQNDHALPPVIPFVECGCPQSEVSALVCSWCAVISRCTEPKFTDASIAELDLYIKYFLSSWDSFESKKMLHKDSSKSKPSWTASSNFPALLNLSSQIKKFGPPRSIWEGGERGEGVVKQLKPLVRGFASNNWDVDLLNNFYSRRSIKNLCDDYGLCTPTGGDDPRRKMFKTYAENDIEMLIENHDVISCVVISDVKILVMTRGNRGVLLGREVILPGGSVVHCGAVYHRLLFHAATKIDITAITENKSGIGLRYCCLLPLYADIESRKNHYYIRSSDWRELNESGEWTLPLI